LHVGVCPNCGGSRLNETARSSQLLGQNLAEISRLTLDELTGFADKVARNVGPELSALARRLSGELRAAIQPLLGLGLGYLGLDRESRTLSTGELQRIHLARTVRSQTTGVLYVLDEPSVGLHPQNIDGLTEVIRALVADGNSVVMVDHDIDLLRRAEHLIEIGPRAGADGGQIVAQGSATEIMKNPKSEIAPYLSGRAEIVSRSVMRPNDLFKKGKITLSVGEIFNVRNVTIDIPLGRLTTVTGVSGSGKTTLILESLVPAVRAKIAGEKLPPHIKSLSAPEIARVIMADAAPIGKNTRSTVATYSGILDEIRRIFAATSAARRQNLNTGHFSHNNASGWCPECRGIGTVSLDIQFLPDLEIRCPACLRRRYNSQILSVTWQNYNIAEVLAQTIDQAVQLFAEQPAVAERLQLLSEIGLGYLTLGEPTPALSGGEAGRLKLMSEMTRDQLGTLIVCDEPSIGLHPRDVQVFIAILEKLISRGATVVLIEHDLDLMANSDYLIDLGPDAGDHGGQIVATGTPAEIIKNRASVTGRYLREHLE
jgi:excinuclease ABC subunit A